MNKCWMNVGRNGSLCIYVCVYVYVYVLLNVFKASRVENMNKCWMNVGRNGSLCVYVCVCVYVHVHVCVCVCVCVGVFVIHWLYAQVDEMVIITGGGHRAWRWRSPSCMRRSCSAAARRCRSCAGWHGAKPHTSRCIRPRMSRNSDETWCCQNFPFD
jgi:hypothetical protein